MSEQGYGAGQKIGGQTSLKDSLPAAIDALGPQIDRLIGLRNSLEHLADRIVGSRPQPTGAGVEAAPPHSLVDNVKRKRNTLEELITACEQQRDRLDNAL
jgi:hypothetical protein